MVFRVVGALDQGRSESPAFVYMAGWAFGIDMSKRLAIEQEAVTAYYPIGATLPLVTRMFSLGQAG